MKFAQTFYQSGEWRVKSEDEARVALLALYAGLFIFLFSGPLHIIIYMPSPQKKPARCIVRDTSRGD